MYLRFTALEGCHPRGRNDGRARNSRAARKEYDPTYGEAGRFESRVTVDYSSWRREEAEMSRGKPLESLDVNIELSSLPHPTNYRRANYYPIRGKGGEGRGGG